MIAQSVIQTRMYMDDADFMIDSRGICSCQKVISYFEKPTSRRDVFKWVRLLSEWSPLEVKITQGLIEVVDLVDVLHAVSGPNKFHSKLVLAFAPDQEIADAIDAAV